MNAGPGSSSRAEAVGARWQLRLLGDVVLTDAHAGARRLPGRTATALLARLALVPDQAQGREALIELLWPGVALAVGRNRLRQLLSTLKRLLDAPGDGGMVLQADRLTVRLRPQALACDAARFEAACRAGLAAEARALYRGELLPGHYDEWIHEERLRLAALADRLAAAPEAPGAAAVHRSAGSPNDATLGAGVGTTAGTTALNLPHYLTRLHGAGAVIAALRVEVQTRRLVTLLGPGGHGKTRLAVELALGLTQPSPQELRFDLVAFVPLVAVCAGPQAAEALLAALLLALRQAPADMPAPLQLQRLLAGRRTLLLLDNVEHLVDDIASAVTELLAACPGLHLLATSRRALGLDGECCRELPPLPLPAPTGVAADDDSAVADNPAVALFVDRAQAVRADFRLHDANRAAVTALVRHLQGMPLAIELAASRVRSLSPARLLTLLERNAATGTGDADALSLLARTGPRAAGDPRHASMLAVVQWSWQLLSPAARRLLPRLAIFAGSFSLAAVAALGDDTPAATAAALDELVAHSMLRGATPDDDRYTLFELVREFAARMLPAAEATDLRRRHRRWLTAWFRSLPLAVPLQCVRLEMANLASALLGAEADGAAVEAAELAAAAQAATSALSLPPAVLAALQRCADLLADPVQRAVTRAGLSRARLLTGQTGVAERLADQAMAELPDARAVLPAGDGAARPGLARALVLTRAAHVRWRLRRDTTVQAWLDEAMALAEAAGSSALQATILTNLGALRRGSDPAAGIALQRRAVTQFAAAGDRHGVNVGRCNLALALLGTRDGATEALALAEQAGHDSHELGDLRQQSLACNLRGEAWSRLGCWDQAAAAYRDCIAIAYAEAEPWPLVYGLWNLPRTWAHLCRPEAAARLMGFIEQHAPGVSGPLNRADRHDLRRLRRLCERQATAGDVARWWHDGASLDLSRAVSLALRRSD